MQPGSAVGGTEALVILRAALGRKRYLWYIYSISYLHNLDQLFTSAIPWKTREKLPGLSESILMGVLGARLKNDKHADERPASFSLKFGRDWNL